MGKVINEDNLNQHQVKKFEFAALEIAQEDTATFNPTNFTQQTPDTKEIEVTEEENNTSETSPDIDTLLQKIDTLSDENIKTEMRLETLQKEFDEKIKSSTEEAYQKGKEEGVKDTQQTLQEHNDDLNMQLVKSITALEEQLQSQVAFLNAIEDELVETSTIIATKIIKKELEENSHKVALTLADTFLKDLKEASSITLKVNPKDAHFIQEHFKEQKTIMIDADDAINKGGIIILSDIGNIDGNIDTRLKKAIALIEREG